MTRFDYGIGKPTGICASTGAVLDPGDACIATLSDSPDDDGLIRQDFSIKAWDGGARPEHLFSYWKTKAPSPETAKHVVVDDQLLQDLFERLADDDRGRRIALRFIVTLILLRRRQLRYVGREGEGDSECWLMRPRGSDPDDPPIAVRNPHLTDDNIRELTDQLSEVLRGDL